MNIASNIFASRRYGHSYTALRFSLPSRGSFENFSRGGGGGGGGGEKDTRAEGKGCKGEEGGGLVVVSGRKALVRLDDIARRGQLPRLPPRHRALYAPGEGIKRTCHVFPDPPRLRNLSFRRPY